MDQLNTAVPAQPLDVSPTSRMISASLPSLNQALEPALESCTSIEYVLIFFQYMIGAVYSYSESATESLRPGDYRTHIYEPWQARLSSYRSPHSQLYREPESLQVAQIVTKISPVQVWSELEAHVRLNRLGGNPLDVLEDKGEWYTKQLRGRKWLIECALAGLVGTKMSFSSPYRREFSLRLLMSCQPKYGAAEHDTASCSRLDIFGPGGLLFPVLEVFTRDPEDESGVEQVLQLLMHQAMSVTHIFERSLQIGEWSEARMPSYEWYFYGLREARAAFIDRIRMADQSREWSYHIRDGLKDLHFLNLWDGLWQQAIDICRSGEHNIEHIHYKMHMWLVQQTKLPSSDPRPWIPNGSNLGSIAARLWDTFWPSIDGEPVRSQEFYSPYLLPSLDLLRIERCGELINYVEEEDWGHRFYLLERDEDNEADFNDDEDEDSFEPAIEEDVEMEAYGPLIDPNDLAEAVHIKPTGQRCTVCMENHDYNWGDGRTMKLGTCGHYFHYECIRDWLNGTSTNNNLCPECRQQFSEDRRSVRPVNSSAAVEDEELDENLDLDLDSDSTFDDQSDPGIYDIDDSYDTGSV